jgi:hypothetical protein
MASASSQDATVGTTPARISPCCPTCQNLDPNEPVTDRKAVSRSPLGFRTRTLYSDEELLGQWGAGRIALVDRDFEELKERRETGCIYCGLLLDACNALDIYDPSIEINIWLEPGQNPKVTVWTKEDKHNSFELFTNRGKALSEPSYQ